MKTTRNPELPTNTPMLGTVGHRTHCTKYTPEAPSTHQSQQPDLLNPEHCY